MALKILRLKKLMNEIDKDEILLLLSDFKCSKNKDSENFLKNASMRHDLKDISRTYVAVDDEQKISGYYTLAMKCMNTDDLDPELDREIVNMMNLNDGIAQAYLIGQLARADDAVPGLGRKMLDEAVVTFSETKAKIGCRMVRLDCKDELIDYYRSYGFRHIRRNSEKNLNQMAIFI
jgi:predicted GNAT family N-acyltransferase